MLAVVLVNYVIILLMISRDVNDVFVIHACYVSFERATIIIS